MIFVAVGTQKFPFNRLLSQIDTLLETGVLNEPVFAQIGSSTYRPVHYPFTDYMDKEAFDAQIGTCDLLITHSGVGTIISGITQAKPVVVMPRLARYGEHVDDHQLEIATSFAEKNYVAVCEQADDLAQVIQRARTVAFDRYHSQRATVMQTIQDYLDTL